MKSGIAGLLLLIGLVAIVVSLNSHYFANDKDVWTESEVKEIEQLSFNLHAATVPGAELEGSKEIRESRLKELYAKQDESVSSAKLMTNVLWWGGFLSCVAGIVLTFGKKAASFQSLPDDAKDVVAENAAPAPPKPTKNLGPESLGPENWR